MALFVMAGVMILSFHIFHAANRWQGETEARATALLLAQRRISELQESVQSYSAFQLGLSSEVGTSSYPGFPEFQIRTEVADFAAGDQHLYSPSRAYELAYNQVPVPDYYSGAVTDERRSFATSALRAQVTVSWPQDKDRPIQLVALLREPKRRPSHLQVTTIGPLLLHFQEVTNFSVKAFATDGSELKDVTFRWIIRPVTSYGTVYQTRNGQRAALRYADRNFNGLEFAPPPGRCKLAVVAQVNGTVLTAETETVDLVP
jgi:hypothetical protein